MQATGVPVPPRFLSVGSTTASTNMLKELTHDLNRVYSVISYAAHFLTDQPSPSEREELQEVLSRYLTKAKLMLSSLADGTWTGADLNFLPIKKVLTTLSALLNHMQTERLGLLPVAIQQQIGQLKQMIETSIY